MTQALFTSRDGGEALRGAVVDLVAMAAELDRDAPGKVDVQAMCFAFTDPLIAAALERAARERPGLTLRVVADWSQGAPGGASALGGLLALGLPNLFVKFKLDAPYRRDPATGRLSFGYGASLGMLHHKTLLVRLDGRPVVMAMGSFNWSARGRDAYENLLMLGDGAGDDGLMADFAEEFEALWGDHRLAATPRRAGLIARRMREEARAGRDPREPRLLADILGVEPPGEGQAPAPGPRRLVGGPVVSAFSGSGPLAGPAAGHAPGLDRRAIDLLRPSGARRPAPLTLNTLALEAIRAVPAGATLKAALYALSPRVPEWGELVAAARRGARVEVLLDGRIGGGAARALRAAAAAEGLPMTVRLAGRRMHQKYVVCPETGSVLTGTANMTADATLRHAEHRVLFRAAPALAAEFAADFDAIWARLPAALAA